MKERINNYITDALTKLNTAQLHLTSTNEQSIIINENYFDEKFINEVNVTDSTDDFKRIKLITNPVLYWFELSTTIIQLEKYMRSIEKALKLLIVILNIETPLLTRKNPTTKVNSYMLVK